MTARLMRLVLCAQMGMQDFYGSCSVLKRRSRALPGYNLNVINRKSFVSFKLLYVFLNPFNNFNSAFINILIDVTFPESKYFPTQTV